MYSRRLFSFALRSASERARLPGLKLPDAVFVNEEEVDDAAPFAMEETDAAEEDGGAVAYDASFFSGAFSVLVLMST